MQKYTETVLDSAGAPLASASVTIQVNPLGAVATIYSDNGVTLATNPLTTNASGVFQFYAADGRYDATITKTGYVTSQILDILLDDPTQGVLPISQGGTGSTTSNAALTALTATRSETGAVAVPLIMFTRRKIYLEAFGGVGDNATLNDTAFANAIAAASSSYGKIEFGSGVYRFSGANVLNKANVLYEGQGDSTIIRTTSATANIFTVSAERNVVAGMKFDSTVTRTGGWYVDVGGAADRFRIQRFWMSGAIGGVRVQTGVATATIAEGEILDSVATTGIAIRIDGGLDVSIRDILADQASQIYAGVLVTAVGDVTIEDSQLIHCGQALFINPGAGQIVTSVWARDTFLDNSTRGTYVFAEGAGAAIARCKFDNCWLSSSTSEGARLATSGGGTINGTEFNGCHIFLNAGDGIAVVDTGVTNTRVSGGAVAQNTGSGFTAAANVSDFSIQGARIGPTHGLTANGTGITLSAGTGNNYQITNNDIRGNTTAAITNGATGTTALVSGNLGHNPVGLSTVTFTSSPMTITAGASPETWYVYGGTVSDIAVGGLTVATATSATTPVVVDLDPWKSMVITATGAPTIRKNVH